MDGAQVPAPEEGYMVFCFSSPWAPESSPWSGTVLARPCPLPLHTLTSHPGSVFPAKSPERTWPEASLSETARQVLQISGLSEKVAQVSPAPEGHPWLAGSSPPAPPPTVFFPSPSQAGRRQQIPSHHLPEAATGNLSYARPLQISASQPCLGTAAPDRAPLPAAPPLESWHQPASGKKSSLRLYNCSPGWPWLPTKAPGHPQPATTEGEPRPVGKGASAKKEATSSVIMRPSCGSHLWVPPGPGPWRLGELEELRVQPSPERGPWSRDEANQSQQEGMILKRRGKNDPCIVLFCVFFFSIFFLNDGHRQHQINHLNRF